MRSFPVKILAADHPFYEGKCLSLTLPTSDGMYGILAHHSSMIAAIAPGMLRCQTQAGIFLEAAVSAGLAKVEQGEVLILVDTAERPEEIDAKRAQRGVDAARETLTQRKSILEYRAAQATLARAANRLRVKRHAGQ